MQSVEDYGVGNGNAAKRPRSSGSTLSLLVPSAAVSGLIGKGGSQIKLLEGSSGAHVSFTAADSQVQGEMLRKVTVTADTEEAISMAVQTMLLSLQAHAEGTPVKLLLLVPDNAVSKLIGARGSVVTKITQSTGAFVSFAKVEEMPPEMQLVERVCTIAGEVQNMMSAQGMVSSILAGLEDGSNNPSQMLHRSFSPSAPSYPSMPTAPIMPYMGSSMYPSPSGYSLPNAAMQPHSMQPQIPNMQPQTSMAPVQPTSGYQQLAAPMMTPSMSYGALPPPTGASSGAETLCTVYIPGELVGMFIGAKGRAIKELQAQCGDQVFISVAKEDEMPFGELSTPMRAISLKGSAETVHRAQQIIQLRFADGEKQIEWTMIGKLKA